jgi:hypothetical protein
MEKILVGAFMARVKQIKQLLTTEDNHKVIRTNIRVKSTGR